MNYGLSTKAIYKDEIEKAKKLKKEYDERKER
jgi:hypothetical protein